MLASHPDCAMFVERFVRSEREGVLSRAAFGNAFDYRVSRTDRSRGYRYDSRREFDDDAAQSSPARLVERHGNPDDARIPV